ATTRKSAPRTVLTAPTGRMPSASGRFSATATPHASPRRSEAYNRRPFGSHSFIRRDAPGCPPPAVSNGTDQTGEPPDSPLRSRASVGHRRDHHLDRIGGQGR